jgi:hypothetical protein
VPLSKSPKDLSLSAKLTVHSDFGGRAILVVVGPDHDEFLIHGHRISKTSFFARHGFPEASPNVRVFVSATQGAITDAIKDEQDGGPHDNDAATGATDDQRQKVAKYVDYVLDLKDSNAAKAFRVFVESLYSEQPGEIKDRETIKTALKAYRYARRYDAYILQNAIVERFREHYLSHKVRMDELHWMLKNFGDDANGTPLTRYLMEQVAHDISTSGFNKFSENNSWLKIWLQEGDHKARLALVAIIARHANDRRHPDPAEGRNEWRVIENGETAGTWVAEPFCTL